MSVALLLTNNLDNSSKESPTFSAQLHLRTHDLFWANSRVQLHLPPVRSLDLLISPGTLIALIQSEHGYNAPFAAPPPSDCIAYRPWPVGTDQSRSLPEPPSEFFSHPSNFYELHRDDMNGNYRRGKGDDNDEEEDDETAPKLISPYGTTSRCSSSSVYISMSAVPSLHEWEGPEREGAGLVGEGAGRAGVTRIGRSESVYSNREAIEREAWKGSKNNSSSASHDSHVTLGNLKEWEAKTQS